MRIKAYKPKELIKIFRKNGWEIVRQNKHTVFYKEGFKNHVSIPMHNTDVCPPMVKRLFKEANIIV